MAKRRPGHWVWVRWLRVHKKGSGSGQWFWKRMWRKWAKPKPAPAPKPDPKPAPGPIEMYDDVNVSLIPVSAEAVAGYVDGRWPTYVSLVSKFPHAKYRVSIAVFSRDNANVLDVEPGDATISEIVSWVKRQHARGEKKPGIYTAVSWAQKAVDTLKAAGFEYGVHYVLWTAHYTYKPHLCSSNCGFGFKEIAHATQWTDKAGGRSLDESLVSASFFS